MGNRITSERLEAMSEVTSAFGQPAAMPVVRTLALGGGPLSRALQTGAAPLEWTAPRPGSVADWRAAQHAVQQRFAGRDWLAPLAPAFAATGAAAERLAHAASQGIVVTTGQQPGLFGGPMYTWSKAIAALALADQLQQELGIPVAPIFWAATDDADWEESATTYVVGAEGLEALTLNGPSSEGVALAEIPLGDMNAQFALLRTACGSAANAGIMELLESAYVPHATIGDAYLKLLRAVLEPLGIAVLDAAHPAVRTASDPLLRRALVRAGAVAAALQARGTAIRDHGFEPQVDDVDGLSVVFRTSRTERGNMRERVPVADAAAVAREAAPGTLGANVLLRPTLERALLPTIAYVAGPSEFAYFAQVQPVAAALDEPPPLAVPRWAGRILEPHVARLLERLQVDEDAFDDPHVVESRLARTMLDEGVADALERMRVACETQLQALERAVRGAEDIVAGSVLEGAGRNILHRLDRLERRIVAGVKRRETDLMRDIAVARAAVKPMGQSPERVLCLIPALARYGPEVLALMRDNARLHAVALVTGDNTNAG